MFLKKEFFFCTVALALSGCGGGSDGSAPSAQTEKDYAAIASSMAATTSFVIPGDLNGDCAFDSGVVTDGNSVTAYNTSSVAYGQTCVSETRSCVDGVLSGSYNYSSCAPAAAASCLFNGNTIEHGDSVNAFKNSNVAHGESCELEARTCNNGVLSGSNAWATCLIDEPASCLFNGQTIAHESNVPAFLNSTEAFGNECQLEYRSCDNGVLSGSNQYAACNVGAAASCLFNGQTVAHGESVPAFLNSTVEHGASCVPQTRTCYNGELSGSNQYASCNVGEPASCLFNGQTVAHGQTVNAYDSSNVEYGQMCSAETRVCDNGHLSGSFNYASCDQGQAASCLFNGQTIPHGASVQAFSASTAPSAEACIDQQRTCDNGSLTGSYQYASCDVQAAKDCLFNGKTIQHGQSVVAYKSSEAKTCEAETRVCSNGSLSGSYAKENCKIKNHGHHDDDEDEVKVCKLVVEIKHKEKYCQKPNSSQQHGWIKYKERYNCGKHKGWYKHKNRHENPTCKNTKGWYTDKKNH